MSVPSNRSGSIRAAAFEEGVGGRRPRVVRAQVDLAMPPWSTRAWVALRIRRREQDRGGRALRDAHEHRPLGADGIHHREDVVHALLERRSGRHTVGAADSTLVEEDQRGRTTASSRRNRSMPGSSHAISTWLMKPSMSTRSRGPFPSVW